MIYPEENGGINMKLYMYAIIKPYDLDKKEFRKPCKIMTINEVEDSFGFLENIDEKQLYSPWDNGLPGDYIGKVFKGCDYGVTPIVYSVYLLEDDKTKAFSLIKETALEDFNNIKEQLEKQNNIIKTIDNQNFNIEIL